MLLFDRLKGTFTDPASGAVVDHYSTVRLVSQPVQHVEYVAQENIHYVQHLVPEVMSLMTRAYEGNDKLI
jgi:hypothetical protein